ncbi:nucleoside hydrolase [Mesorhizobium sp. M2A.F.Ca.ET.037.01.1.1]|uniref:nucleoside hydrolase n=1 Tax=unclassified Mesorhizobium TaxID=325217 RepID=UPI000FCA1253|nr:MULTISPECIES: nucleoside hydrolase [unclassified Mesorhizobium]RUX20070.1 nucleoside hydrolase [Mesorhizobium sp. M2A.F.Ca.ET.037.01.1.1]RUY12695.1 nucleoside hydrolase [Mesorhizobium sp. M2A.F.Ca.ET.040.01.1.1]RWA91661.1 MAG: nucleoside hydrolase [Mesorhizobium sp.]TIV16912.1 MAG: nucleoside hydrolase [Mesorhizobium sp.]
MPKHRIVIDCDPGVDDAVAILLAFASPEIEVLGITTVAGNVPLEYTTRNALRICELAGRTDVPVFAGCRHAMFPTPPRTSSVHGDDGLGDVGILEPSRQKHPLHAVDFIVETILKNPGEITLCAIGPLTNVALALVKEPAIASKLKQIVFMGGAAFCPGNTTPAAEFNIWFDPLAGQIILNSGARLVMFGLDVTNKVIVTSDRVGVLQNGGSEIARQAASMMVNYGGKDPALHDPCVTAFLIDPSLFDGVHAKVEIDYASSLNRGRTVAAISERHRENAPANCYVVTTADDVKLFDLLNQRLLSL